VTDGTNEGVKVFCCGRLSGTYKITELRRWTKTKFICRRVLI
jgi:hypothetical protein